MKLKLAIEHDDSHYEVEFDIDDPATASERLAATISDVQRRFVPAKARETTAPKRARTIPTSTMPVEGSK